MNMCKVRMFMIFIRISNPKAKYRKESEMERKNAIKS